MISGRKMHEGSHLLEHKLYNFGRAYSRQDPICMSFYKVGDARNRTSPMPFQFIFGLYSPDRSPCVDLLEECWLQIRLKPSKSHVMKATRAKLLSSIPLSNGSPGLRLLSPVLLLEVFSGCLLRSILSHFIGGCGGDFGEALLSTTDSGNRRQELFCFTS